jgi:hypothetical protein
MDIDTKDYIGLLMFVVFWVLKVKFQFFLGDHQPNVAHGWWYLWILPHPEGMAAEDLAFSLNN